MDTEAKPIALIVHENRITASRVRSIMSQRGWNSEICDDGDKAVDEYVRIKPDMVFMGLNLPTMDGHVAALEIRESDPQARVVFVVSKSRLPKANDAAYSAGAVAVLVTPLTRGDVDQKWVMMNGPIPEAPGLRIWTIFILTSRKRNNSLCLQYQWSPTATRHTRFPPMGYLHYRNHSAQEEEGKAIALALFTICILAGISTAFFLV